MSRDALDAHVDGCDGGPPLERYRPQAAHGVAPPLEEVTLHRVGDPAHWHLVTRGLTELDAKESPDPSRSGWGFELTLRLERREDEEAGTEQEWAVNFLTNLAAYVWTSGNAFAAGHHLDLRGPMKLKTKTSITAAAIVRDPGLDTIDTPYGSVEFLQVVGMHAEELELCRSWNTEAVVGFLAAGDPWLVTRLDRPSLLADPSRAARIARLAARDGSSLTELRVATLRWRTHRIGGAVLTMGSGAAAALGPALRRELIGPGAGFVVISDPLMARFTVSEVPRWRAEGDVVEIGVPLEEVEGLAALFDGRTGQGRRPAWPGLRFRVVA
ncbi:MAG: suppressor of fused domain protein [Candidatus Dormibacteraeota bacterium]|nr:suppressor of fused domain protein [Candidatus Dormibacteraeota bacterium]